MSDSSVLSLLRERAGLQPDDAAFTYIDYEQDWAGITETLTWSEVFRRTRIVAHEVRRHCTTGDRAVILAPQGLAYIAAFLGSMQAGAIAVPLSVPQIGSRRTCQRGACRRVTFGHPDNICGRRSGCRAHPPAEHEQRRADHRNRFIGLDREFTELSGEGSAKRRVLAVHLWLHPRSGWGHDLASEPSGEFPTADVELLRRPQRCGAT